MDSGVARIMQWERRGVLNVNETIGFYIFLLGLLLNCSFVLKALLVMEKRLLGTIVFWYTRA